ncbi:immunoglobulin-like domain-containing protein [uncultured Shewanella sp.]|uniref:immunoglobulin-like domain-containing protein n=1 Tax=uncultured Shewanella sp. TaxID=173975 RepID=UPI00261A52F8|nr:immunoglobulin-like domain-containing protein [uncultured Shewanella sp.]
MKLKQTLLACLVAASFNSHASTDIMPEQSGNVLMGYWHNWCNSQGYQSGVAACIKLTDVNTKYNVVAVSFMTASSDSSIPTFTLSTDVQSELGITENDFIEQISELNQQGRSVVLSLGGADAHIELSSGDETALANEIIRLVDTYGFDGIDIDLEQSAISAGDNNTVIPQALIQVKEHYQEQGLNFMITMAPEYPYLRDGGAYVTYIEQLEGYYDFINPQFYNQGGDGIWIDGKGWLAQNDDSVKSDFIYYIADSLINGTNGYTQIDNDKLVFGLPTNIDAANNGYVSDPQDLYTAFTQLSDEGHPLKGIMGWSVNWDMGTNVSGQNYNSQFVSDYASFILDDQASSDDGSSDEATGSIEFSGIYDMRVQRGESFNALDGVSATDAEGKDITSSITTSGSVDTSEEGTYTLYYTVTDSNGNKLNAERTITVYNDAPVLNGIDDATISLNSEFDPLEGVSATDSQEGDLTDNISIQGEVNTAVEGSYTLTYTIEDQWQASTSLSRVITVTSEDITECSVDTWSSTSVYNANDTVSYAGQTWTAQWWTQGEEPGTTGEWGVWRTDDTACSTVSDDTTSDDSTSDSDSGSSDVTGDSWSASTVYTQGETVSYSGQNWEAQWWTQGDEPGTTGEWGVWRVAQ